MSRGSMEGILLEPEGLHSKRQVSRFDPADFPVLEEGTHIQHFINDYSGQKNASSEHFPYL